MVMTPLTIHPPLPVPFSQWVDEGELARQNPKDEEYTVWILCVYSRPVQAYQYGLDQGMLGYFVHQKISTDNPAWFTSVRNTPLARRCG